MRTLALVLLLALTLLATARRPKAFPWRHLSPPESSGPTSYQ
jgi:hypothetical protein